MTEMIYLKPKEGLRVPQPLGKIPLPPHGRAVVFTTYWRRRLADGDVEKTTEEAVKAGEKKAEQEASKAAKAAAPPEAPPEQAAAGGSSGTEGKGGDK